MIDPEEVEIMLNPEATDVDISAYIDEAFSIGASYVAGEKVEEEDLKVLVSSYLYLYKYYYISSESVR